MEIVIEGLGEALDDLSEQIVELNGISIFQHNELISKMDVVNEKFDAVHTMLSHIADAQAAQGVQLNAIMAALYAHK